MNNVLYKILLKGFTNIEVKNILNHEISKLYSRVSPFCFRLSWLEQKSSSWAGSTWLGDKVKVQAWLCLGSKEFEIFELRSACAWNKLRYTSWARLGLMGKWTFWARPNWTHLEPCGLNGPRFTLILKLWK